jgi:hypothetical protein
MTGLKDPALHDPDVLYDPSSRCSTGTIRQGFKVPVQKTLRRPRGCICNQTWLLTQRVCQGDNQWMAMSNSLSASTIALTRGI